MLRIIMVNFGVMIVLIGGLLATEIRQSDNNFGNIKKTGRNTPLHKALLTQRGYIQFLRWKLPVPDINEFTFCLWVKSSNLTYPHSIFSYSRNEKQRVVRAWIAPFGRSVHLEINNVEIFGEPTFIRENQWYHICQSWNNKNAQYGLWIDGQNKLSGYAPEMAGYVIPRNGDIILGQEFTDFDKGLEEGIEGAVLGFNLLLSSAFDGSQGSSYEENRLENIGQPSGFDFPEAKNFDNTGVIPISGINLQASSRYPRRPMVLGSMPIDTGIIRARKTRQTTGGQGRIVQDTTPLGLRLIEISFNNCESGRASPFIGGTQLLISWSRTPVGVFGGAIIKNVDSQCGVFNALS